MEIIFSRTDSDNRTISKHIVNVHTSTCVLKNNTGVLAPTITANPFEGWATVNYAYIPSFGRYYFVNTAVMVGALLEFDLRVDVLTSFADKIKDSYALIYTQGSNYNILLNDGRARTRADEDIVNVPFVGGELNNRLSRGAYSYVLTAYRGVGEE